MLRLFAKTKLWMVFSVYTARDSKIDFGQMRKQLEFAENPILSHVRYILSSCEFLEFVQIGNFILKVKLPQISIICYRLRTVCTRSF